MTHFVYGYPDITTNNTLFSLLSKYSDYVEIQFPFSDPIADGSTISEANMIALKKEIFTKDIFEFIANKKKSSKSKIVAMCYFHTLFSYGIEEFIREASRV